MCPAWDDEAQSTKNAFFCLDAGNAPSFYMLLPSNTKYFNGICCEGCYMLLHVVTRFAVWLGVTAHGLQSETSLNIFGWNWQSWWRITSISSIIIFPLFWAACLGVFHGLQFDFYGESPRNRSVTVSCQVRFFVLKHWVPVCSCQWFFERCKVKPIHRSTNYLDLGLSQNSND